MSRILVIRLSSLGDIVLTLPALHAIRANHADLKQLAVVVRPKYASLLGEDPVVDTVLSVPRDARDASRMIDGAWDLVIDLQGTAKSRAIARRVPARERRTVKRDRLLRWQLVLRARIGRGSDRQAPHVAARFLETAGAGTGAMSEAMVVMPRLGISGATRDRAAAWLTDHGWQAGDDRGWIALLPGAAHPVKAWPPEHYVELGRRLRDEERLRVLVLGGTDDASLVHEVVRGVGPDALGWHGDGDLPFLAALLEGARVAVANDSGLAHLAVAAGCSVVSIFGPTVRGFGFAPGTTGASLVERMLPCRPCSLHGNRPCRLGTHACVRGIETGEVFERAVRSRAAGIQPGVNAI